VLKTAISKLSDGEEQVFLQLLGIEVFSIIYCMHAVAPAYLSEPPTVFLSDPLFTNTLQVMNLSFTKRRAFQ